MSGLARLSSALLVVAWLIPLAVLGAKAQGFESQGHVIGKVSVDGNLILMELNRGALGGENLFDLNQRTLRFRPTGGGYRVENLALEWDADFGTEITDPNVALRTFSFPFSGKTWDAISVGVTGSIRFGPPARGGFESGGAPPGFRPRDLGGISVPRFAQLREAAGELLNTVPAICVFFKPRMHGKRYVKELADRVVVTWDLTEPYGNIQDFSWHPTVNRFQAVLSKNGTIQMSYQQLAAQDAIIGVYPLLSGGPAKTLATLPGGGNASAPANLNLVKLELSVVDQLFLKVTFETSGAILPQGDRRLGGTGYRVHLSAAGASSAAAGERSGTDWTIFGFAPRNPRYGRPRYVAFGPGLSRHVEISGRTISIAGLLPPEVRGAKQITVSASTFARGSGAPLSRIAAARVAFHGIRNPDVHLASLRRRDGPFPVVYEAFHYYALPEDRDLACTVIQGLGDRFDFLAYYSDFRVDNQEAGTPSNGPRGGGTSRPVTGIALGDRERGEGSFCSQGRFQWGFIQPVYAGAIQMQKYPPGNAPLGDNHDITFYRKQFEEISENGEIPPYLYAMSQIGHEMGHRWGADAVAKVDGKIIPLGPVHWARGLQAPVPFPYVRPTEASIMGGGVWQDNFDGTFTELDDNYYVPATGYSYLDLYLMGLISPAEVPDFFLLRHLKLVGQDVHGHPIFTADRTKITIEDVIAAQGPRQPDVRDSERHFNTGIVVVVQHGRKPSPLLIREANGIRNEWMKYFSIVTGRRATMTANP